MHRLGLCLHVAFGMEIGVEGPARFAPVDQLVASDFDQSVPRPGIESRRFGVEDYLSHLTIQSGPYRARKQEAMARIWRCVSLFGRPVSITKSARARLTRSGVRSEEHTSELQSLMRISYAVFCLKKKTNTTAIKKP